MYSSPPNKKPLSAMPSPAGDWTDLRRWCSRHLRFGKRGSAGVWKSWLRWSCPVNLLPGAKAAPLPRARNRTGWPAISPGAAWPGWQRSKTLAGELPSSAHAEAQLDDIWLFIARESGSIDTANRVVQSVTDRFWLLARYPRMGRRRSDLSPELRSFAAGDFVIIYSIEEDDMVAIHHVFRGSQDIESLFHF